jgi:hypothetical protein
MTGKTVLDRLLRGFRLEALVFDLAIAAAGYALPALFLPTDDDLLRTWSTGGVVLLVLFVVFFVVMQMGLVWRRFRDELGRGFLLGLASTVIGLATSGLYVGMLIFLVLFKLIPFQEQAGSEAGFVVCALLSVAALWGYCAGFPYEPPERRGKKLKKVPLSALLYVPLTMLLPCLPIGALVVGNAVGWFWGLLLFLGGVAAVIAPMALQQRYDRWTPPPLVRRVAGVLLPIVGAAMLLLWQRLFVLAMRQASLNNFDVVDVDFVFWWAVGAGLVPFRAISLLAPPISPLNVAVAVGSFAAYLSALYGSI